MKIIYLILIFLFVNGNYAQNQFSFRAGVGYSDNNLTDLRHFISDINNEYNQNKVPTKILDNFPAYFSFHFNALYNIESRDFGGMAIGLNIRYFSSGARVHYKDYSGEAGFDALIDRISYGLLFEKKIIGEITTASLYFNFSQNMSDLETKNLFRIGESEQYEEYKFNASYFSFELGAQFKYPLYKSVSSIIKLGYEYAVKEGVHYSENENVNLVDASGNNVFIDWSGYRVELFFEFTL